MGSGVGEWEWAVGSGIEEGEGEGDPVHHPFLDFYLLKPTDKRILPLPTPPSPPLPLPFPLPNIESATGGSDYFSNNSMLRVGGWLLRVSVSFHNGTMIHSSELILFDPNVHSLAPGVGLEHLNKESNM